eukprot:1245453-Rhodomonas_salina.5
MPLLPPTTPSSSLEWPDPLPSDPLFDPPPIAKIPDTPRADELKIFPSAPYTAGLYREEYGHRKGGVPGLRP